MRPQRLQTWTDSQYENPRGLVGMYIGEKMVRQHRIEVDWTIAQLTIHSGDQILDLGCGAGDVTWDGIQTLVREQFIPAAKTLEMIDVSERRGPNSRDYHTVAVTGRKA